MPFSPTPLTESGAQRFGVKKNVKYLWATEVADLTAPTAQEIDGSTDITCDIQASNGFTATDNYAEVPDLCADVTGKVWNGATLEDSSLTFYLSTDETDAYSFFTTGDTGFIIQCPYGLTDESPCVVWSMEVGTVLSPIVIEGAALVNVAFAPKALTKGTLPTSTG